MQTDLVSVVIPTFNRAYCVSRAIDSVLAQTHGNVEVLVVDDGSTDNTREVIAATYHGEPRVRYIFQQNAGVCVARNTGLEAASGEFIGLLDSDDLWLPWKLQVQLAALHFLPDAGMVWTDMEAVDQDGRTIAARYLKIMYHAYRWFGEQDLFSASWPMSEVAPEAGAVTGQGRLYSGEIYSQMVMGNLVHTSTVLLRRERLHAVGGFDPALRYSGEDYDFHLRTCREGPVAFIDLASIRYLRGLADQLTQPRFAYYHASNFLTTVYKALDRDRERIRLPAWMIRDLLADSHEWVGHTALDLGNAPEARRHLLRSLRLKPWQPALALRLPLAFMPAGMRNSVRSTYARLKSRFRGVQPGERP